MSMVRVMVWKRGFTLIEILVSVTIVLVISGAALATFLDYQNKRVISDEASAVAERLRTVQIKATAVEVPAGCGAVDNYAVALDGSGLTVSVNCLGGGVVDLPELGLVLTRGAFETGPQTVVFDSQTISAGLATIDVCGNGVLYRITVNQAANVGRPVFVAGGC